jgi:hypothetical protein
MNPSVAALAKAAGQGTKYHIPPEFINDFTKLFVAQCVFIIDNQDYPEHWSDLGNSLFNYFGVEEEGVKP